MEQKINDLSKQINLSKWLTPLNLVEVRKSFLINPNINPILVYPEIPKQVLDYCKVKLDIINESEYDISTFDGWIVKRKIDELALSLKLLMNLNSEYFSKITCDLYECNFTDACLNQAKIDAKIDLVFDSKETLTPQEVVEGIKKYLHEYDIDNWIVITSQATDFYIRVKPNQKTILVSDNLNWDFTDFDNILAHEIDGHVLRSVNAQKQVNNNLCKPLPFYIKTEEGLASFLGDYCSSTAKISRKHHALKYLAGYMSMSESFVAVYEFFLANGFTQKLAFQRTFRLKRGISNTKLPGLFAKEAMYYEGMQEIKEYIENNRSLKDLYQGKIGIKDIPFLTNAIEVTIPKRLIDYIQVIK